MTVLLRRITIAAVLMSAAAPRASAQALTIDQLVTAAIKRSPDIQAARAEAGAAQGQVTQARLRPNPMVMATRQEELGGSGYQSMASVAWPLELYRRPARITAALREADVAAVSVLDRERLLAAAIRGQAGRLLAARRTLAVSNDALTAARQLSDLLARRAAEGAIPQLEANQAAIETWRIEAEQVMAAGESEAALIELKAMVGLQPDAPLELSDSLEAVVRRRAGEAISNRVTIDQAPGGRVRPDVQEAAARVALADAQVAAARSEGRIDASIQAGYAGMRSGFPLRAFDGAGLLAPIDATFHNLQIGATLVLPLWNRNQGAIASAESTRSSASLSLAARELTARAENDSAMVRARDASRAVDLYAVSIRDLARHDTDTISEAYALGGVPLMDVIDSRRRAFDLEQAYTAALVRAYEAQVALRAARGEVR